MLNIENLTIKKAHEHLADKDFSAVELARGYLDVIAEKDKEIHAYLEVFDDVLEQAKQADEITKITNE